jgi:hypothetical protein
MVSFSAYLSLIGRDVGVILEGIWSAGQVNLVL